MKSLLLTSLILFPCLLGAQTAQWTGLSLEHEVSPRWAYLVDVEYRRELSQGSNGEWLLLAGFNRTFGEAIDLTAASRYNFATASAPAELRLLTDLYFSKKTGEQSPITLKLRLRYHLDRPFGEEEVDNNWQHTFRSRLGADYKISDQLSAFGEYEARFLFAPRNEWSRIRYTGGLEYQLMEAVSIEAYFRLEKRINQAMPSSENILGLYFTYVLPDRRKRDWDYRHPFGRRILN